MSAAANPLERLTRDELLEAIAYYAATGRALRIEVVDFVNRVVVAHEEKEHEELFPETGERDLIVLSKQAAFWFGQPGPNEHQTDQDLLTWLETSAGLKARLEFTLASVKLQREQQCN